MQSSFIIMIIIVFTVSGCCGLGSVSEETSVTYSSKSQLHKEMTLTEAQNRCNAEADSALDIWRKQCDNAELDFNQLKEAAPPTAKRMIEPLTENQRKWYCKDIQQTPHFQPNVYQRLDSSIKLPLNHIQSSCIKELGFIEYKHVEKSCRSSFFGPY